MTCPAKNPREKLHTSKKPTLQSERKRLAKTTSKFKRWSTYGFGRTPIGPSLLCMKVHLNIYCVQIQYNEGRTNQN